MDVFMCSMDQCGFYELQDTVKRTGGKKKKKIN